MRNSWEKLFRLYPLVPLAVGCTFGICSSRFLSLSLPASGVLIGFSLVLFAIRKWLTLAGILFFFSAGSFIYGWRYETLSPLDVRLLVGEKEALVTVRGELLDTPTVRETHYGEKNRANSSARVRVTELFFEHEWHRAEGVISTATRQEMGDGYFAGQKVEVAGVLQVPARAVAPGLFDFREYLYNQRIFYVLRADSTNDWKIISSALRPPIQERFRRWAKVQLGRGLKEDEALRLIWAMTLGWQSTLSGEVSDPFMKTGTLHVFAVGTFLVASIGTARHVSDQ